MLKKAEKTKSLFSEFALFSNRNGIVTYARVTIRIKSGDRTHTGTQSLKGNINKI